MGTQDEEEGGGGGAEDYESGPDSTSSTPSYNAELVQFEIPHRYSWSTASDMATICPDCRNFSWTTPLIFPTGQRLVFLPNTRVSKIRNGESAKEKREKKAREKKRASERHLTAYIIMQQVVFGLQGTEKAREISHSWDAMRGLLGTNEPLDDTVFVLSL